MEPSVGFEPTTYRLQGGCSATELTRRDATVYGWGRSATVGGSISETVPENFVGGKGPGDRHVQRGQLPLHGNRHDEVAAFTHES